jgi:hypothetical protein
MEIKNEAPSNNDGTVWAVVDSGTRRLVCRIGDGCRYHKAQAGDVATVYDAFELHCAPIRVPTPQGILHAAYDPVLLPLDLSNAPVTLTVHIENIRRFSEMEEEEARAYSSMRENLLTGLLRARAQSANLTLAKSLPNEGTRDAKKILLG